MSYPVVTVTFENLPVVLNGKDTREYGTVTVAYDGLGGSWPTRIEIESNVPGFGPNVFKPSDPVFRTFARSLETYRRTEIRDAINHDLARGGHFALFAEFRPNEAARSGRVPDARRGYRRAA